MPWRLVAWILLAACRSGGGDVAWQPPIEVATGGGTKGRWQQNASRFDYVDDPSVALAADGSAAVVWVDHRDKDVHFQRYAPDGMPRLPAPANVSRTPEVFSWLPRLVVAGDEVAVAWQEIIFSGGSHGGDLLLARSHDGGATFSLPINLSRSRAGDGKGRIDAERWHNGSFDLVRGPDGTLAVAWTTYEGTLWFASAPPDGVFEDPARVAGTRERPARAPALAAAGDTLYLGWTYGEDPGADIHVAARTHGRFNPPAVVARTPTYSDAPKLVWDGTTLHLAYAASTGGPFDRARIVYTRSRDGATFAPPRAIGDGTFPALAVEGARVIVLWEPDVGARARGLAYAISHDGGDTFSRPALVPHSRDPAGGRNGSFQGRLMRKLAARGEALAVVNSALAHGHGSRVWLIRGRLRSP